MIPTREEVKDSVELSPYITNVRVRKIVDAYISGELVSVDEIIEGKSEVTNGRLVKCPSEEEIRNTIQKSLKDALFYCGDGVRWLNEDEKNVIKDKILQDIIKLLKGE
jgi:hypothetical protein